MSEAVMIEPPMSNSLKDLRLSMVAIGKFLSLVPFRKITSVSFQVLGFVLLNYIPEMLSFFTNIRP